MILDYAVKKTKGLVQNYELYGNDFRYGSWFGLVPIWNGAYELGYGKGCRFKDEECS